MATDSIQIVDSEEIIFERLVCFKKELSNPRMMKKEMDQLIRRLDKHTIKHQHKVITKVIHHNREKKTILMQIMVPVINEEPIETFLADYEDVYYYLEKYALKESIKASIPNDMNAFRGAVDAFVQYANMNDVNDLDFKNNHIIEIAKVDIRGTILGFDLHMEK